MFRSARWRNEKNRIKAVFKLQFRATQVPQLNAEGLTLSLVPGDLGKPTARLEKAIVRGGCCRWETPVYETVKFVQDPKTGKVNQRIYYLIVSTKGSARAGLVGEAPIDFAEYADAIKTSNISLPLQNSNSKAVLHVSIQRQLENADLQREVDESERPEQKSQGNNLKSHLSNGDADESNKSDPQEVKDGPFGKTARNAELRRRTSVESDSTTSSSESVSELEAVNRGGNIQQDHSCFSKSLSHPTLLLQSAANIFEEPHISESEWSGSSDHGISTDDSTNSSNDTIPGDISRNSSDVEIEKLRAELVALTRQADLSELELQSLRKQIVKESKRGQDLLREVTSLKLERDSLKAECEMLKASEKRKNEGEIRNKLQYEGGDPCVLQEEIQQELDYEKDLNSNLRLQLQKTQESNTELILAVQDLEAMLEQRSKETADPSPKPGTRENTEALGRMSYRSETDEDEDQKALEELVKGHKDTKETHLLEQKIMELHNEIEIYKRDKDELEIQMEQLALDYEILKQENHDISYKLEQSQLQEQLKMQYECSSSLVNVNELENQVESLETELKNQSEELSESFRRTKELEMQIEGLEEELEKQTQIFEADIEAVTHAKVEQEQRAIRAEEALRKTRWKNASVAEKLQEEFKRLSEQMASTFDANEKMAMRAMTEANELRMQKRQLEEMLKNANDELKTSRDEYEARLRELSEVLNLKTVQINRMVEDLDEKAKQLENQKRHEEDVTGNLSLEITRLRDKIGSLRKDKNALAEEAEHSENLRLELEEMKKSIKEAEASVQRGSIERNELSSTIASVKKESEHLAEDLHEMERIKDEKVAALTLLESEIKTLRAQCDDLKHSLYDNETEKEKLKKQVVQLKGELKKKEEAVANLEKKLRDSRAAAANNGTKTGLRNKGAPPVTHGSKEVSSLKERIKLLEGQIKLKENALEASSNMFMEKERDLKNRIEELEITLEELNQKSATLSKYQSQEEGGKDKFVCKVVVPEERTDEPQNGPEGISDESRAGMPSHNRDNLGDLLTELASLRERNRSMEIELKEMQERYSEISLRFAEVEGERQQLVMTVRNLKNAKKS